MARLLGLKITLTMRKQRGGPVGIQFATLDQLDRIVEILRKAD